MKKIQQIAVATALVVSLAGFATAGTITGSKTGTITGSKTGTITGSKTGTITGSKTGTITGSRAGTITGSRATGDTDLLTSAVRLLLSLYW
jgi:hypothetical protein